MGRTRSSVGAFSHNDRRGESLHKQRGRGGGLARIVFKVRLDAPLFESGKHLLDEGVLSFLSALASI